MTLLGIRPDIIRMQELIRLLDTGQGELYKHRLVHSGQHFDDSLSGIFYRELGVRAPDLDMGIGYILKNRRGDTGHIEQSKLLFNRTAEMIEGVKPDAILYLGDTNTVLSSIVAAKYQIPVIHIEGGGRSYDWRMPEEKNRIIADHLSDMIYCYLDRYKDILLSEGIPEYRIKVVGNIIVDAIKKFLPMAQERDTLERFGLEEKHYVLVTLHREENTEPEAFSRKLSGLRQLAHDVPVVFPIMPRVKKVIEQAGLSLDPIRAIEPLGFLDFLRLEKGARLIVTDSGTVQEEALLLGVPCLVARRSTERPETIQAGATILSDEDLYDRSIDAMSLSLNWNRNVLNPRGGSPSERIYRDLLERIKFGYFSHSRQFLRLNDNSFAREAWNREA